MNKIITLVLVLAPFYGFAQVDWESAKGAIKSEEIIIEKDKQLVLPRVSRRFSSITVAPILADTLTIKYEPKDIKADLPKIPVRLRPRTMKSEELDKTYWGNVKLGFGSYTSPYVLVDVASKRNDEYAIAAHFRHFSSKNGPIDGTNSGLSNTDGYLSGKLFLNKVTLGANLGGQFDKYHLYGYGSVDPVPETNSIEQKLSNLLFNFSLTDNDTKKDFYYQLNFGGQIFNAQRYSWTENDFNANLRTDFNASDKLKIKVLGAFHFASQNTPTTTESRMYFSLKPIATYTMDAFDFELGAGVYGTKDSINSYNSKLYITPHVVARYNLESGQRISAGVRGDVTWQSARTRFNKNPFLGASTVINSDVKPIEAFLEANGKLAPKVDFSLGYKASVYTVYGQFVNNASDQSTFYINYQEGNNVIQSMNGQVNFSVIKNLLLSAWGKYLLFNFKDIENVYHVPQLDLGLKARFILENKFDAELSLAYLDGIYAFDNATLTDIQLNSIFDLNISASYKINSSFSVFIKMQNILGNQYQYYNNYPSKGFQALAGVSFRL